MILSHWTLRIGEKLLLKVDKFNFPNVKVGKSFISILLIDYVIVSLLGKLLIAYSKSISVLKAVVSKETMESHFVKLISSIRLIQNIPIIKVL